jgi:hypothetical protein
MQRGVMPQTEGIVLVIGSSPDAARARGWVLPAGTVIVAINNAWAVRPDWHHLVHPKDFPAERLPRVMAPGQHVHSWQDYVPAQNRFGGFVYAGGTMAFTTAYWALATLRPQVMAFVGCDMVYAANGDTHFYGMGRPDPLRDDPTLQSLEAKSARLQVLAAREGCACVNLTSLKESRLVFPRMDHGELESLTADGLAGLHRSLPDPAALEAALSREQELGYYIADGRYWRHLASIDAGALADLDRRWLRAAGM